MDRKSIKSRLLFWYTLLWILLLIALYLSYSVYFPDTHSTKSKWVALFAGAIALLLSSYKLMEIFFYQHNSLLLSNIAKYFLKGLWIFNSKLTGFSIFLLVISISFLFKPLGAGFIISMIAGSFIAFLLIHMTGFITVYSLVRFSDAVKEKIGVLNKLAFNSGVSLSLFALGLGISAIVILFHIFKDYQIINGILFGNIIVILPHNIAGAISKRASRQACDVINTNMLGDIDKNDKRNPLLLLKGLSNSVLKSINLVSLLFICYNLALISAMTVGGASPLGLMGCFLPLIIAANGLFASIISLLIVRTSKINNPLKSLYLLSLLSIIMLAGLSYYTVKIWMPDLICITASIAIGGISSLLICFCNSNYVFKKFRPVKNIVNSSIMGLNSCFVQTIREGFMSVVAPLAIIAIALCASFLTSDGIESPLLGIYGISLFVLGFLSTVGIMLCISSFGLEIISYKGIFKSYEKECPLDIYKEENVVSQNGYYLIALSKNFINASAILTSIIAMISYTIVAEFDEVDILNPYVLTAMIFGVIAVYLFCAFTISISLKTAKRLVFEVKRQFRNFPQILRFELRADYEKCVEVCALNCYTRIIFYTFIIVIALFVIAYKLSIEALAGFIAGAVFSSFGLVFFINSSSISSWGAQKYFESEYINIENSSEYSVIKTNNRLLETLKDLIIPSLSILILFLSILSLCLAPIFM